MTSLATHLNAAIGLLKAPYPKGHALVALLERDHRTFEDLVERIVATSDRATATRTRLWGHLRALLRAHEHMEERALYPTLAAYPQAAEIVRESLTEHHVADVLVRELSRMDIGSPDWRTKVHVLGENLKHHIAEEERSLFPQAKRLLSGKQLDRLAVRMQRDRGTMLAREARPAPRARARSR